MYDHGVGRVQVEFPVKLYSMADTMEKPDFIRNICIVGHVDHGKSTVTDSLIAKAELFKGTKTHHTDTR